MVTFRAVVLLVMMLQDSLDRNRHSFNKTSIVPWCQSSNRCIVESKDDSSYMHAFGMDIDTFDHLLRLLVDKERPPRSDGRPRMPLTYRLALFLRFLNSTMAYKDLTQISGVSESTVCRVIHEMMDRLLDKLSRDVEARILWPTPVEIAGFQDLVRRRHPNLKPQGMFGFIDGCQLRCQNHPNLNTQNGYYNGRKHDTFVSNVFVFVPDGTIAMAMINFPGSQHDARVARKFYPVVERYTPEGAYILGDSAFNYVSDKIVTTYKRNQLDPDPLIRGLQKERHHERTSARQTVEWGNGQLQRSFPRLTKELSATKWDYNHDLILICLRLFNLKTRRMKVFNQVATVFQRL